MIGGVPTLLVDPSCPILIEGLAGGFHYPELKEGQSFSPMRDTPFKDGWFEHIVNAFEYGMVNIFLGSSPAINRVIQQHKQWKRNYNVTLF